MKRKILLLIAVLLAFMLTTMFVSCSGTQANADKTTDSTAENTQSPENSIFDSKNIVYKLAIMSDVHINMGEGITSQKFETALEYLKEVASEDINAISFAGDLTDNGQEAEAKEFKRILEEHLPSETAVFYALGNHDDRFSPKKFAEVFGEEFFKNDVAPDSINKGHRHAVIDGYHFLTVKPMAYWSGDKGTTFIKSTLTWLTETLDAIVAEEPDKPIFVVSHSPVAEMGIGSYLPQLSTFDLKEVLEKYPQVIYTSGHLHNPIQNETAIMQDKFTTLDGGVIYYAGKDEAIEKDVYPYVVPDNESEYNRRDHSMGTLVEIDKNNALRITRIDYHNKCVNPVQWVIPPVKADGSHLSAYRDAERYEADAAPYFSEDATITYTKSATGKVLVKFTAATDEAFVHHYKIDAYDVAEGKVVYTAKLHSGFFMHTDMSKIQSEYICTLDKMETGKEYEIRVRAFDSWYKESEPLVFKVIM